MAPLLTPKERRASISVDIRDAPAEPVPKPWETHVKAAMYGVINAVVVVSGEDHGNVELATGALVVRDVSVLQRHD